MHFYAQNGSGSLVHQEKYLKPVGSGQDNHRQLMVGLLPLLELQVHHVAFVLLAQGK